MAIEVRPPNSFSQYRHVRNILFAGGSIEMDKAKPWQRRVVSFFRDRDDMLILNPRRDEWNASWKQTKTNKNFRQQVEWELEGLETANTILMYFDPATKSPITLLEVGLFRGSNMHVVCPSGFWRKGNVDIVCERYGIPQYSSLTAAMKTIKAFL
jgi:Nucleoside 2-deoxyribosyltransferase like